MLASGGNRLICESQLFSVTTVCYCSELAVLVSLERKNNPLPESEKNLPVSIEGFFVLYYAL